MPEKAKKSPRKGQENLIPYSARSKDEARENGRKGGLKSGEVRREKKSMSELAKMIASQPASGKNAQVLKAMGIPEEEATNNAVIVGSVFHAAASGNMQAVEKWTELTEEIRDDDKVYELPARVIGQAFVDINRRIVPNMTYVFEGGRGGLKSSYVSLKIIEIIKNNPMMHACCVRKVAGTLRDSVYAQIKWAVNELGLMDEFEFKDGLLQVRYKKTGQIIYFRGCDDPIKLKSIKPPFGYIGVLWKEEKDQLSGPAEERSVNQSVLRGGDISYDFSSYNPPKTNSSWVNKEKTIPNPNRIIHHSTYLEAPEEWLGTKFIEDAEHLKEVNPSAYEHEYMGIPNGEGGQVFEYVDVRTIDDEEYKRFDHIYQGLDWGFYPDPVAFIRLHYDVNSETIFLMDELYEKKWANSKTAQWIIDKEYTDEPVTCDSAEPKSIQDLRDNGLNAKTALKGPGSVEYGMKWLQIRRIVIDPKRTPNAMNEIINYEYERDREDNVVSGYPDANNHLIDAIRYALERYCNRRGTSA